MCGHLVVVNDDLTEFLGGLVLADNAFLWKKETPSIQSKAVASELECQSKLVVPIDSSSLECD